MTKIKEIDIRQIEIFLMVAKYRSISQAAKALYTSQPSVSNWIAKMELDCGVKLFVRTNRGISLTPEGEEIYSRLDVAYQRFRVSVSDICRKAPDPTACLRVGFLHREEITLVTRKLIGKFLEDNIDVRVETEMYNFHELRDKLMCHELDLAISASYDISAYSYFDYVPVGGMEPYFFLPPAWADSRVQAHELSFLNGKTLILEAPTHLQTALDICRASGITPGSIHFANSYLYLTTLVSRGHGFSVDSSMRANTSQQLPIVMIPAGCDGGKIVVAWRRGVLSGLAEKFLASAGRTAPVFAKEN